MSLLVPIAQFRVIVQNCLSINGIWPKDTTKIIQHQFKLHPKTMNYIHPSNNPMLLIFQPQVE